MFLKQLSLLPVFLILASVASAQPGGDAADTLAKLKAFDYSQPMAPLHAVERMLAETGDPAGRSALAGKLAALLGDAQTTPEAKAFICKQLPLVAGEAEVAAMARLLEEPKLFEAARAGLEATPLPSALSALRGALAKTSGADRIAVIHSLGARRDAEAVPALAGAIAGDDVPAACAAALALGRIATPPACEALKKARGSAAGDLLTALRDAQLEAGDALAAADPAAAAVLYEALWDDNAPKGYRLAALRGLLATRKEQAVPQLLQALDGPDTSLYPIARSLAATVAGEEITKLLVIELGKLQGAEKAALVDVLAGRRDGAARSAVMALLDTPDAAVQLAAVRAMAELGDAACVPQLLKIAAASKAAATPVRAALARMKGAEVDAALLAAADKGEPPAKAQAMRSLADRKVAGGSALLLRNAADPDAEVAAAALAALAVVGEAGSYEPLVALAAAAKDDQAEPARKAVLAVAQRLADPPARLKPVLAALEGAKPPARCNLLRVLGGLGSADALPSVRAALKEGEPTVVEAGVRALADWPDASAGPDLLDLAAKAPTPAHRVLAMRGFLRMAAKAPLEPGRRTQLFQQARDVAATPEAKRMLLAGLMDAADPAALQLALGYLGDKDVQAEAVQTVLALGTALASTARPAVQEAMGRLEAATRDKQVINQARTIAASTRRPLSPAELEKFLATDPARSAATKKALAEKAPAGYAVVAYLDCGSDRADGKAPAPTLSVIAGQPWFWPGAETAAPARFGSVWFSGEAVTFQAGNLKADRNYQVGLAWWDFDHNNREQSLWAVGKDGRQAQLVKKTALPTHQKQQMPQELVVPIPRDVTAGGSCRIEVRREGKGNCVACEIWLLEAADASAAPPPATPAPAASAANPASAATPASPASPAAQGGYSWPAPPDNPKQWVGPVQPPVSAAAAPAGAVKLLIVTGDDLHNWKATAPCLADLLAKDKRFHVAIAYDPRFLADKALHDYDVIVLHYVKWHKPDLEQACMDNLKKAVADGKGLVVVHFACGAFQKWDEFVQIAGRVYNPKLRGHDPHGTFTVRITDDKHPITKGMKDFQTLDELYTCLDGQTKVDVLAVATSKVDKKDYPMAIVLTYGKGKVFHCPLGHDPRAFEAEGVQELFRRGTAWVAGKE